ncbi:MAG: diacylglycerol kinase [Colwellia sp.]
MHQENQSEKPNGIGLTRIFKAFRCSMLGFKSAYTHEAAFRQELILAVILLPLSFLVSQNALQLAALICSILLLLLIEVVNSAIEAVVDRIGPEHHELSGRAKDLGSSAVFLAFIILLCIWASIIYHNFFAAL